jgi:drug/metabolite transporter (DMT)-like permease
MIMNPGSPIGVLAVAIAVCLWGIQLPIAKGAFETLDPFHLTSIRYAVPSILMLTILVLREGRSSARYESHFWSATLLGVIGMCGSPALVFIGMAMSRADHAAVIVAMQPSIAAIALWTLRGIRPANFTLGCIVFAFAGVVLVITQGQLSFAETRRELFGDLLVLIGAACWVAYSMGTHRLSGWSTWRVTVLTMIPGAIATIVLTELLVLVGYITRPTLTQIFEVRWELGYLSFIGVFFALLAWNFGNRRIGPQNSTLLINLLPVSTFVYLATQGQEFAAMELIGASLVVAALIASNLTVRSQQNANQMPVRTSD